MTINSKNIIFKGGIKMSKCVRYYHEGGSIEVDTWVTIQVIKPFFVITYTIPNGDTKVVSIKEITGNGNVTMSRSNTDENKKVIEESTRTLIDLEKVTITGLFENPSVSLCLSFFGALTWSSLDI
jgi:hypothetical protein